MTESVLGLLKACKDLVDLSKEIHIDKETMAKYLRIVIAFATFVTTCSAVLVYWSEPSEKELVNIVRAGAKTAKQNQFAGWLLKQRLHEISADIQHDGRTFRIPQSELDVTTLEMMNHVTRNMVATSSDASWWKNHRDYSTKNTSLAPMKKITRIFLYRSDKDLQNLQPVLREQKQAGIEVLTAPIEDSEPRIDYVVIDDGKIAGRLFLGKGRKPVAAEFDFDKADIEAIQDRIEVIRQRATRF